MNLDVAQQAAAIAPKMLALQQMIVDVQQAMTEHWLTTTVIVTAPATGSAKPAGSTISLVLPGATLDDATSQLTMNTALGIYQQQLAQLQAELDAL